MLALLLLPALGNPPLVRVNDPDHPNAIARSATGSVLAAPPQAGPWADENVPHIEAWVAEEALDVLNVEDWHTRGADGAGVKVAVFDLQWFGAADPDELGEFTTHDCWEDPGCNVPIDVYAPNFSYEAGVHGYACAEIIHDIAPAAELHLVRVNGPTTFENAVDWAIANDIDVASISMSFFNDSYYDGSGPVAQLVQKLADHGVLLVASAGNYGERHWEGAFSDVDADGLHDFDGEGSIPLDIRAGASRAIYLSWNQHDNCGKTDLDAVLVAPDGTIADRAEHQQSVRADQCSPVERLRVNPDEDGLYTLEVHHRRGATSDLRVSVLAPGARVIGAHPGGGIPDPGASPHALTIGAVRATDDYLTRGPEPFSSLGPTYGGYDKPDLAGPDGLSTSAFGARGFYGTSAATPAVAGLVAVVMSEDPELDAFAASDRLRAWAWGGNANQHDPRWGWGKARLPPEPTPQPCGRRPMLALLLVPPLIWRRRDR